MTRFVADDAPAAPRPPRTVLYIDEGVSFGGSLVVSAMLIKYLDPSRYRAVVVGEAEPDVLDRLFGQHAKCYRIPRAFNYRHRMRLRERFGGSSPRPGQRLARHLLLLMGLATNVPYYLRLTGVIVRERVDLIHHSNGRLVPFLVLFGKPLVATAGGIFEGRLGPVRRFVLSRMSAFIMISEVVRRHYLAAGGRADITALIPNPCDIEPIPSEMPVQARKELGLPPSAKAFGIAGRVVPWKGQREFLAAAELVLADLPEAVALIVGDAADDSGDYFEGLKRTARQSRYADRIVFTGYMADTRRAYAVLDVAVHASIEPEPFGLVIIEALGYGVPVVAADTGAPPEIVEEGVDGFLVDPKDASALAGAIKRLLTDDALRGRMAERGRQKVLSTYQPKPYAERVQRLYDEVFDRSRS